MVVVGFNLSSSLSKALLVARLKFLDVDAVHGLLSVSFLIARTPFKLLVRRGFDVDLLELLFGALLSAVNRVAVVVLYRDQVVFTLASDAGELGFLFTLELADSLIAFLPLVANVVFLLNLLLGYCGFG